MDTFGFTRKKFITIALEARHRHLARWLSGIYQKLTANRITPASLKQVAAQYNRILGWSGMAEFIPPDSTQTRSWLESISDRIHFHRCKSGLPCRDHDLLKAVQTGDLENNRKEIRRFNCHMALDGLRSVFNVGSIFRSCEAAGFESIILGSTPGAEHPGVQKTAMGSPKWIKQEKTEDLAETLIQKQKEGYTVIGLETMKNACSFDRFAWEEKSIIVLGNEEYGISSHVLRICDDYVHIPMFGRKNSINVANAAAIICFQAALALSG